MLNLKQDIEMTNHLDLRIRRAKVQIHKWWNNHHYNGNPNDNVMILTSRPKNAPFISLRNDEYGGFLENMGYLSNENDPFKGKKSKYNSKKTQYQQPLSFKVKDKKSIAQYPNDIKKVKIINTKTFKKSISPPTNMVPVIKYENLNRAFIYHDKSIRTNKIIKNRIQMVNKFIDDYDSLYELELELLENVYDSIRELRRGALPFGQPKTNPQHIESPPFKSYTYETPPPQILIPRDTLSLRVNIYKDKSHNKTTKDKIMFKSSSEQNIQDDLEENKENMVNEMMLNSTLPSTKYEISVDNWPENIIHIAPRPTLRTLFSKREKATLDSKALKSRYHNFEAIPNTNYNFELSTVNNNNTTKDKQHRRAAKIRRERRLKRKMNVKSFFNKIIPWNTQAQSRFEGIFKWFSSLYKVQAHNISNIIDSKVIQDPNLHNNIINILSFDTAKIANNKEDIEFIKVCELNEALTNLNNHNNPILVNNTRKAVINRNNFKEEVSELEDVSYLSNRFNKFSSYRGSILPYDEYEDSNSYAYGLLEDYQKLSSTD